MPLGSTSLTTLAELENFQVLDDSLVLTLTLFPWLLR